MGLRIDKPWQPLQTAAVARLSAQLGVYQIADRAGQVLYIGAAGGRSLFGLRGQLQDELTRPRAGAAQFRVEVTMQYTSRLTELLMLHRADYGTLPRDNREAPLPRLGRLSPA